MRDLLVMAIVCGGALYALRKPWIGVLLWVWISIMNPHRFCYGFARDAPVAQIAAIAVLLGLLFAKDRESPFKGTPVTLLAVFTGIVTASWLAGLDPGNDYWQWNKVMKIFFMIFIALALLRTKEHILGLAWVTALSMGLLGAKGGYFTVTTGGNFRVWGPEGSFIEDNNEFALACVIAVPLLRFLQMQVPGSRVRHLLSAIMVLCVASTLGSQSRGSFLALLAMGLVLWWRGRAKMAGGIVILTVAVGMIAFMPDEWGARMSTIGDYEVDNSAQGRISAWWNAWNLAFHYPLGVGFDAARPELFAKYSPLFAQYGTTHAAHSIYFQVLGNHGFGGLLIFVAMWVATWRSAGWLRRHAAKQPESRWCADLGAMCQVSLVGYLTGGAFLSLSYFDLPYNVMTLVVLARVWVQSRAWEREAAPQPGFWRLPGLVGVTERDADAPKPPKAAYRGAPQEGAPR